MLGCGVDVIYPKENTAIYEEIKSRGVLISEVPVGTRVDIISEAPDGEKLAPMRVVEAVA